MASPVLIRNLCSTSNTISPCHVSIHASPFGSRRPTIPTAKSVTVARVASPISTDRTYQNLFLRSLKAYFDASKRLVKQDDLIAITLDTDAVGRHDAQTDVADSDNAATFDQ